jgi:uncharacterized Zn-binding protein involved in type VI secretion
MLDTSLKYAAQPAQGGSLCLISAFYFTPASELSRRHFRKGDKFPDAKSTFGKTHWQFHINQNEHVDCGVCPVARETRFLTYQLTKSILQPFHSGDHTMSGPLIRLGDKTSHGGVVIEASPHSNIAGVGIARMGDKTVCPKHGQTPIISGDSTLIVDGKPAARDGDKTGCGATLIAGQQTTIDNL